MTTPQAGIPPAEEPTIGRLVADTTRDFSTLIRDEIQLAKTELKVSVRAGGISVAMFMLAGFLGLLAIIMGSFALAYFFDWWFAGTAVSFLIVFGIYFLLAALLAGFGVKKIRKVKAPEKTIESVKETTQVLKRG